MATKTVTTSVTIESTAKNGQEADGVISRTNLLKFSTFGHPEACGFQKSVAYGQQRFHAARSYSLIKAIQDRSMLDAFVGEVRDGRPALSKQIRDLVLRLAQENLTCDTQDRQSASSSAPTSCSFACPGFTR